eukprot:TRINITY_DN3757_c0_g1_i2.p1 TRINITY_DN3757_c0_g1~~TRINITY_DN3757_c0_g1_i2.p1  ORF type:complete len:144 (+),score=26.14 TRINITY_DN3757_c0_g1_i2:81-512(+)
MKPLGKTGGQHTKRTTRKLLRYSVAMGLSAAIGAWALSYFAQGRIDNMERNTNKKQKDTPQLFRRREIERKIAAEKDAIKSRVIKIDGEDVTVKGVEIVKLNNQSRNRTRQEPFTTVPQKDLPEGVTVEMQMLKVAYDNLIKY